MIISKSDLACLAHLLSGAQQTAQVAWSLRQQHKETRDFREQWREQKNRVHQIINWDF